MDELTLGSLQDSSSTYSFLLACIYNTTIISLYKFIGIHLTGTDMSGRVLQQAWRCDCEACKMIRLKSKSNDNAETTLATWPDMEKEIHTLYKIKNATEYIRVHQTTLTTKRDELKKKLESAQTSLDMRRFMAGPEAMKFLEESREFVIKETPNLVKILEAMVSAKDNENSKLRERIEELEADVNDISKVTADVRDRKRRRSQL
jgi:hypothetical protein